MKRIASLLLGLAMAAAALSGCGAQGRETAAQEFPDAVSIVLSDVSMARETVFEYMVYI